MWFLTRGCTVAASTLPTNTTTHSTLPSHHTSCPPHLSSHPSYQSLRLIQGWVYMCARPLNDGVCNAVSHWLGANLESTMWYQRAGISSGDTWVEHLFQQIDRNGHRPRWPSRLAKTITKPHMSPIWLNWSSVTASMAIVTNPFIMPKWCK